MSTLSSVFVGVPQSRYAALAILLAMIVVSMTILLGKNPMPMSQKFGFVVLIFLISLPSLAMSLFQLTCIVTGAGFRNQRWWCSLYGWILSAVMIFYAVLVVVSAVMALTLPPKPEHADPVDMKQANKVVEKFFLEQKKTEGFEDAPPAQPKKQEPMPASPNVPTLPLPDLPVPAPAEHFKELHPKKPATFLVQGGQDIPAPYGVMEKFSATPVAHSVESPFGSPIHAEEFMVKKP